MGFYVTFWIGAAYGMLQQLFISREIVCIAVLSFISIRVIRPSLRSQNYVGYWVVESNADFTLSEDSLSSFLKQYNSPELLRFQHQSTGPSGETAGL